MHRMIGMDPCSLAASRMLIACVLLYEGLSGMDYWNARAFLSDQGVWPRFATVAYSDARAFQLHLVSGGLLWVYSLHTLFIVCGLLLLIGWHTRKASCFCWLYWLSIGTRTWPMVHSFDKQLIHILMWGTLGLNWGDWLSVDAALAKKTQCAKPYAQLCTFATLGVAVCTITMYSLTAYHKTDPSWTNGEAVIFGIETRYISRPIAQALIRNPVMRQLIMLAGRATLAIEYLAPVCLLAPREMVKTLAVLVLVGFHIGLGITFRLNDIPVINSAVLLAFLPASFWRFVQGLQVHSLPSFNCSCLQPWTVFQKLANMLQKQGLALPASKANDALTTLPLSCTMHVTQKSISLKSLSLKRIPLTLFQVWIIWWFLWMYSQTLCGGGGGPTCKGRWWTMWAWMDDAGESLGFNTNWKVFSSRPPNQDWWLVFPATLENKSTVDIFPALLGGRHFQYPEFKPVSFEEPAEIAYTMRDERWTKYLEAVVNGDREQTVRDEIRKWLGQFICREWNYHHANGPHRLVTYTMQMMLVDNSVVFESRPSAKQILLWDHTC